jgi:CRISPR-associated protein Cmr1
MYEIGWLEEVVVLSLEIKTPIWTGDIDTRSNLLQSTGFLGSIRWWIEAILRGMGKYACDPTGSTRCPRQGDTQKMYCPVCLIFGASGMRRLFRLEVGGGEILFDGDAIKIIPCKRRRGWYLGSGIKGSMRLKVTSLDKDFDESLVLIPLILASKWGGIGAKTQHGYGVVEVENQPDSDFNKFKEALERIIKNKISRLNLGERHENDDSLPNLKEMFFAKVRFEANYNWWRNVDGIALSGQRGQGYRYPSFPADKWIESWACSGSVPIAPAIKNWLRYGNGAVLWKTKDQNRDREIEDWLFGTIRGEKRASKVNVSCAYKVDENLWEFRVWGWIPGNSSPSGFDREEFLNKLKQSGTSSMGIPWNNLLGNQTKNHKLWVWREFNSLRDSVQNQNDIGDYLQSLLKS